MNSNLTIIVTFINKSKLVRINHYSGVGQSGVPVGLITRRSMVQIHSPLPYFTIFLYKKLFQIKIIKYY
jgi:hypothetical protein